MALTVVVGVPASTTQHDGRTVSLKDIRVAIPAHCFQPSVATSLGYIARDVLLAASLFYLASYIPLLEDGVLRAVLWLGYGLVQGFVFVGIWILAHECGHQALFRTRAVNDTFGLVLHSFLMVPYFSWKYSHGLHHRYTNHMEKDTAFVPSTASNWRITGQLHAFLHLSEDAPVVNLLSLMMHQLLGWPLYLMFHITTGSESGGPAKRKGYMWFQNHFNPQAEMFSAAQRPFVLISDLGLILTGLLLRAAASAYGVRFVLLAYGMPYLWVNHWLVAITYLHHNHHDAHHYSGEAWNFQDGALATVDRDFGFIGRHLFHGIIEYHVIHHLFTIPFYKAEEATHAILPILGDRYIKDETPFLASLWSAFTTMHYVAPREEGSKVLTAEMLTTFIAWADNEIYLYVVSATNLSL